MQTWDPPSGGRVPIGIVYRAYAQSDSHPGVRYPVTLDAAGNWHCKCPDHEFRGGDCKHIRRERTHYVLWRQTPLAALL